MDPNGYCFILIIPGSTPIVQKKLGWLPFSCENELLFHICEKIQAKNIHACNHINLSSTVSWSSLLGSVFAINLWCFKLCHVDESWLLLMTWSNTHKTPWSSRQQGLVTWQPSVKNDQRSRDGKAVLRFDWRKSWGLKTRSLGCDHIMCQGRSTPWTEDKLGPHL